ncbi:MAG TPA: homoserine dehydrogenase [Terriglobales bacterium]|nr:homoserine dehydrogenase [Terriglobales bacterium]
MNASPAFPLSEPSLQPLPSRHSCRVALLGFGTVGRAVATILQGDSFPQLHLEFIYNRRVDRKRVPWVPRDVRWTDDIEEVLASDADVVLELAGGIEPAYSWVKRALALGKSVVTANKKLIAAHGPELLELARGQGCRLEFGAAVAGGVPVLCGVSPGLSGDRLLKLCGILNGTCNFILHAMDTRSVSLAAALREAQQRGYAEAEPSDDVDGLDARAKLAILIRAGFHLQADPQQIATQSIWRVQPADFRYAHELGCTIRQVARAEIQTGTLLADVGPALVNASSPLGCARDNQNVLVTTGKYGGETVFAGAGAGGAPTAVAVVSDLLAIAQSQAAAVAGPTLTAVPVSYAFRCRHYVRVTPSHKLDAVNSLRGALTGKGIKLRRLLHHANPDDPQRSLALVTEECSTQAVDEALRQAREAGWLAEAPLRMPALMSS